MCPDKEIISAFYDKELNEVWSKKAASHIKTCDSCASYYSKISESSIKLKKAKVPNEEIIQERVFQSLERRKQLIITKTILKSRMELSLPVFASAAILALVLFSVIGIRFFNQNKDEIITAEIDEIPTTSTLQLIKMEDAAAFILENDAGFDILITIPAEEGFSFKGEPAFIREADYRRSQ